MSNYKRIDYQERVRIETLLTQGFTCTSIADILGLKASPKTATL